MLALDFLEWVHKIFEFLEVQIFVHWKSPNVINTYHRLSCPLVFIKRLYLYKNRRPPPVSFHFHCTPLHFAV